MFGKCICAESEGEAGEMVRTKIVKARKEHICIECREIIKAGNCYERTSGLWNGEFETLKTCMACRNVRRSLFVCGFTYGTLWEDVRIALEEDLKDGEHDDFDWLC